MKFTFDFIKLSTQRELCSNKNTLASLLLCIGLARLGHIYLYFDYWFYSAIDIPGIATIIKTDNCQTKHMTFPIGCLM